MNAEHDNKEEPLHTHVPDMSTAVAVYERGWVYLDVNCKTCGVSGCLGAFTATSEVNW